MIATLLKFYLTFLFGITEAMEDSDDRIINLELDSQKKLK